MIVRSIFLKFRYFIATKIWILFENTNKICIFLQRVFNGGGRIERECAAGSGRMDLGIEYNDHRYIIEIKLVHQHDSPQTVREEGLEQISAYRDTYSPDAPAYLLIFDRRLKTKEKSWDERIVWEQDGDVTVLGC